MNLIPEPWLLRQAAPSVLLLAMSAVLGAANQIKRREGRATRPGPRGVSAGVAVTSARRKGKGDG